MKPLSIFFLCSLLCLGVANAQQSATLSHNNNNFVYIGLDNEMSFAAAGYNLNEIGVRTEKGRIINKAPGNFIFRIDEQCPSGLNFEIYELKNGMGIQSCVYKVIYPPSPQLLLSISPSNFDEDLDIDLGSYFNDYFLPLSKARRINAFQVLTQNFNHHVKHTVQHFVLRQIRSGIVIAEYTDLTPQHATELMQVMSQAQVGDVIVLEEIFFKYSFSDKIFKAANTIYYIGPDS